MTEPTSIPAAGGGQVPLTAVFFVHLSGIAAPMIKAWLDGGHRISAIVVYRQKGPRVLSEPVQWLNLQWSVMRHLRRHRIPVIRPEPPLDWQDLYRKLAADAPDVAISYAFMRLIPDGLLGLFPRGALNFHPALLPHYRGPQPIQWLAIDDAMERSGGVTLHEMTNAFDEGAIVAQAAMSDVSGTTDPSDFVADALSCMTRHVIPGYCAGEIQAWPQPPGTYPYAHYILPKLVVQPRWTRKYLQVLSSAIRKRPGVGINVSGRNIRLLTEARALGSPNGKPATVRWRTVEFDLSDQRVVYWRHTWLNKFISYFRTFGRRFSQPAREVPIRLGPFDP